ncbi:MAG: hypothetical protein ACD_67C00073G0001 [uncultured bacterium]|nr:MAG: hypothetical protein ACD_67C00073G0001 [uncultured bacterium]
MIFLAILTLLIAIMFFVYVALHLLVWVYEIKAKIVYSEMHEQLRILENAGLAGALLHAKTLRIQYDHNRLTAEIEGRRQFIIENLLFLKKSTLKS